MNLGCAVLTALSVVQLCCYAASHRLLSQTGMRLSACLWSSTAKARCLHQLSFSGVIWSSSIKAMAQLPQALTWGVHRSGQPQYGLPALLQVGRHTIGCADQHC